MSSKEAKRIIEYLKKNSFGDKDLCEARENFNKMNQVVKFNDSVNKISINAQGVKVEMFIPDTNVKKIIVYFHGGGYCLGVTNITRNFLAKVSKESGLKTLLVDYRLAPENPYPAALEDAVTMYKWLLKEGYDSKDIIFAGDSSGCGLVIAALFKFREFNITMPKMLVLISPVIDYLGNGESLKSKRELDPYQLEDTFSISNNFIGDNDRKNPLISPIYGDFTTFPPMLIHASEYDVFFSDSINLAEKVKSFGVDVSIKVWKEMWHVFHVNADILPEGKEALKEIYDYIFLHLD